MGDFLTTAFPVIMVLIASDKHGKEQMLTLDLFPEFKDYNVSIWRHDGRKCGASANFGLVDSKRLFAESSSVLRFDGLPEGQYCFTAQPITADCSPRDFCHVLTGQAFSFNGEYLINEESDKQDEEASQQPLAWRRLQTTRELGKRLPNTNSNHKASQVLR
ncbi:uncharacterized protein LOC144151666 [Haemaphysalis longicornis]